MGLHDFRKLKKLGSGSYGSVYKVRRLKDGEIYAMKVVNLRHLAIREREDAVNEIRLLASMHHHNVVRYCEAFVEREKLYIVLEFAKYGDLSGVIKKQTERRQYFSEKQVLAFFVQLCQALRYLHRHNILHRDLKPQNVFVGDDGRLKLGDFGCSKLLDRVMLARTQVGTPYYMSPEIWKSRRYDDKSDVWSLGCILYELASLRVPFKATSLPELAKRVRCSKTPVIPSSFSSELRRLARSMLAKEPSQRPSLDDIMKTPIIQRFADINRDRLAAPTDATPTKMNLLRTIVVPKDSKAMRKLAFPASRYPKGRPQSSPARKRPIPKKINPHVRANVRGLPHIGRGVSDRVLKSTENDRRRGQRGHRGREKYDPAYKYGVDAAKIYRAKSRAEQKKYVRRALKWDRSPKDESPRERAYKPKPPTSRPYRRRRPASQLRPFRF